jgi:ferredoxin
VASVNALAVEERKAVRLADIRPVLERLAAGGKLVAPVAEAGGFAFRRVGQAEKVRLDFYNTAESPKDLFFPQSEVLFSYDAAGIAVPEPAGEQVLLGIRPCDLAALPLLDRVFGEGPFRDPGYLARRERTVLVAVACDRPRASCFCTSFGLSPGHVAGADMVLYPDEGGYLVRAQTEAGEALMAEWPGEAVAPGEAEAVAARYRSMETPLGRRIRLEGVAEALDGMFDHPMWEQIAARCLSCGICTYTCPTCHCFQLTDEAKGEAGKRVRCWDSCMFPEFTRMAGGHNPRPDKKARVRQRFMHKLNYFVRRWEEYLCVGCGRCVESCPVGLDIAYVIEAVQGVTARA